MNEIERSIIKNSEYIIKYFEDNNREVTNLMLEKLLYFLEAIYMSLTDENKLYDEEFYAWNFGPVNDTIYNRYKNFGKYPIKINIKSIVINPNNKIYIEFLYNLFKDYTPFDLVTLSHSEGSPWQEINQKYDGDIEKNIIIEKSETKKWFKGIISNSVK